LQSTQFEKYIGITSNGENKPFVDY